MAQVTPDSGSNPLPVRPRLPERPALPPEIARELDNFEAEAARFKRGDLAPERWRAFRLSHGVYGQRQSGVQMIRVKIPTGALTGAQLVRLADIAEEFSPTGISHLTTRQDVQYHFLDLERVPQILRLLAEVGLTTREACGNSVRNVTSCPVSGYIADELFDVQPYALATYAFLVRNPFCQQLSRKFKIAFSACPEDCAATAIHDIGLVGRIEGHNGSSRFGFQVLVGGGLGSTPFVAKTLSEFVPVADLLVTMKGILKVFSTYGNRKNRNKARIKFVVHKHGIESFRAEVAEAVAALTSAEREDANLLRYVPDRYIALVAGHLRGVGAAEPLDAVGPPSDSHSPREAEDNESPAYVRWQSTNVRRHRDRRRAVVTVSFPLGDLDPRRLRSLAKLVTSHALDEARIAIDQNLVLPNVPRQGLRSLYAGLAEIGLAEATAGTALDVTSCPGADTCALGITSSKGLARAIHAELLPIGENGGLDLLRGVTIKMSGCPNSCGQHHIANIGFHGAAKKVNGRLIPAYQLHLGGRIAHGEAKIGEPLDKIPAKLVPKAVAALLRLYRSDRLPEERFEEFVQRAPRETIVAAIAPFTGDPDGNVDAGIDWGQDQPFTTDELGKGECAGAGLDAVVDPFDNWEAEVLQGSLFMDRGQWADALANLNRSQYALARVLLEALGKRPDSDYETTCELRAQVIDRGYASELWNQQQARIEELMRTRQPDPSGVRSLYAGLDGLREESKRILPLLVRKKSEGHATDIGG